MNSHIERVPNLRLRLVDAATLQDVQDVLGLVHLQENFEVPCLGLPTLSRTKLDHRRHQSS